MIPSKVEKSKAKKESLCNYLSQVEKKKKTLMETSLLDNRGRREFAGILRIKDVTLPYSMTRGGRRKREHLEGATQS